jgi:PAS domain-containing protein
MSESARPPEQLADAAVVHRETSGVAVVVFDAEGNPTAWNVAAERLFGDHAENIGADIRRCVQEALTGGAGEAELRHGDESELRVTATPLTAAAGEAGAAVLTAEDVTASRRAERELVRGAEKVSLLLEAARYLG